MCVVLCASCCKPNDAVLNRDMGFPGRWCSHLAADAVVLDDGGMIAFRGTSLPRY